jgi:Calcineurin-like phosphoesterase
MGKINMPTPKLSVEVLIETLKIYEANNRQLIIAAKSANIYPATFHHRVQEAFKKFPNGLDDVKEYPQTSAWTYPRLKVIEAPGTKWIIGSDLHVWDGDPPLIYKAFVKVAKTLKVDGIIMNGDVIDGARIGRHPSVRGSKAPKIEKEIETAKKWLKMLPNAKYKLWTLGNHDIRIDNYIAANASELDGYILSLHEHFTNWDFSFAFDINGTEVRHRFRGGIHAGWNNALHSGINIITGHTHQLQITAMRDRRGSRWGVETGMMADPTGPQFQYSEGTPSRSQQGFAVVTFDEDGTMFPPELCEMINGRPVFRGGHVF